MNDVIAELIEASAALRGNAAQLRSLWRDELGERFENEVLRSLDRSLCCLMDELDAFARASQAVATPPTGWIPQ
jgi:hypothetical protein